MAVITSISFLASIRSEAANNGIPTPQNQNPQSAMPLLSLSKPSWVVRTESNVRKEKSKQPDPPCVVCRGSGRVDCHDCCGRGRTNHIHLTMLPKGEWPKCFATLTPRVTELPLGNSLLGVLLGEHPPGHPGGYVAHWGGATHPLGCPRECSSGFSLSIGWWKNYLIHHPIVICHLAILSPQEVTESVTIAKPFDASPFAPKQRSRCRSCGGSGLGYCPRCLGTGEYRYIMGFQFMKRDTDYVQNNRMHEVRNTGGQHSSAEVLLNDEQSDLCCER